MITGMEQAGVDHEGLLNTYLDLYNIILANRPEDLTVGIHTCRGNFKVRIHILPTSIVLIFGYDVIVSRACITATVVSKGSRKNISGSLTSTATMCVIQSALCEGETAERCIA